MEEKQNNKNSYFIEVEDTGIHTMSTSNIEQNDNIILVESLLNEFQNIIKNDTDKEKYRSLLLEWLTSTDKNIIFQEDIKKVRDLIYEMF